MIFLCKELVLTWSMHGPEAEFKEFELRLKFKLLLKYGWFHLKLYSIFKDSIRLSNINGIWQI